LNGISWLFRAGNPLVVTLMIIAGGALLAGAVKLAARIYKGLQITWSHAVLVAGAILLVKPTTAWLMGILYERPSWPIQLLLGLALTLPVLVWLTRFYLSTREGEPVEAEDRVIVGGIMYAATAVAGFVALMGIMAVDKSFL
jgi:hypothetical protein